MNGIPDELIESAQVDWLSGIPDFHSDCDAAVETGCHNIDCVHLYFCMERFSVAFDCGHRDGEIYIDCRTFRIEDPVFGKLRTDHGGITDYIYFSVYFVHFPPEAVRTRELLLEE